MYNILLSSSWVELSKRCGEKENTFNVKYSVCLKNHAVYMRVTTITAQLNKK
jgi:hypothetical protein